MLLLFRKAPVVRRVCGNCASWGTDPHYDTVPTCPKKTCRSPKLDLDYTTPLGDFPEDHAVTERDEGWGIYTGPEFGCVHFKERA